MERRLLLYLFLLGTLPISAQPFSVGAPAQACADLRPQHGGATQSTPSPFELDMEVFQDVEVANVPITHSYMPSRVYSLVLQVADSNLTLGFRGFFIQARLVADDSNVGGFLDGDGYRLSSCSPPTVGATHENNNLKTSITVRWTAPPMNTGTIHFRYTFIQSRFLYWENLSSIVLIERRCDIVTGQPYFDNASRNCVESCPIGFQGVYTTGACDPLPHSYQVSHTADVFYARIENSTATLTAIINYTVVINSLQFNGFVLQATLSLLGTSRTEIYFRLSNGTTSRLHIIGDPELMIDGSMTVIRESIILFNSPVPVDTYVFELGVIVFGSDHTFGLTTSMVLVQVVESTDPCSGQPSSNEETCPQIAHTSPCPPAYTGTACDILISPCALGNCLNGASCTNISTTDYTCSCATDYTGQDCEIPITSCLSGSANCINGICLTVNGSYMNGSYMCDCYTGWTGERCESDINFCEGDSSRFGPCNDAGSIACIDFNSTFSCTCAIGFTSFDCSQDIDECESSPCHNNGTCTNSFFGNFECRCTDDFTGPRCKTPIFPCEPSPCQNGGTCTDLGNGNSSCSCPNGFGGDRCEEDRDVCEATSCLNGGTCFEGVGSLFFCMCAPENNCSVEIPQCMPDTCRNGGTCTEEPGISFNCSCPSGFTVFACVCVGGFTGGDCSIDLDFCTPDTCHNGGTCMDGLGDLTSCLCADGFTGPECEIDLDFCEPMSCHIGGTCIEGLGRATSCACIDGFTGGNCQTDLDFCTSETCPNGSTCMELLGIETICMCPDGFTGGNCSMDLSFCTPNTCQNGGTCIEGLGMATSCNCADGFSGDFCEEDLDFCTSETCLNDGTCMEGLGIGTTCVCPDGFTGGNCSMDLSFCTPTTCQNGGTCQEGLGRMVSCDCPDVYYGSFCEQSLPEPVTALAVLEVSEHTISLSWSYQSSGSQQRTGVEVIVERSELLERMTVGADDTFATFSSLLPLTNYTVTLYVLSEVGRSLSTAIQASTLSLKIPRPTISMFRAFSSSEVFVLWEHPAIETSTTTPPTAWMIELSLSTGEVVEHVTLHDNGNTAIFTDLDSGREYQVRVAGENSRGTGFFSNYARTTTYPEVLTTGSERGFSLITGIQTVVIVILVVFILFIFLACICYYKRCKNKPSSLTVHTNETTPSVNTNNEANVLFAPRGQTAEENSITIHENLA